MDPSLQAGELSVQLLRGEDLKNCDWFGQQDPYVILRCGQQQYRSNTHACGGTNPIWDQLFVFKINKEDELKLAVWDKDVGKVDDCVGKAKVSLAPVRQAGPREVELKVPLKRPVTRRQQGFVILRMSFIPDSSRPAGGPQCPVPTSYSLAPSSAPPCHPPSFAYGSAYGGVSTSGISLAEDRNAWAPASGRPPYGPSPSPSIPAYSEAAHSFRLEDPDPHHTAPPPPPGAPAYPLPSAPSAPAGAPAAPPPPPSYHPSYSMPQYPGQGPAAPPEQYLAPTQSYPPPAGTSHPPVQAHSQPPGYAQFGVHGHAAQGSAHDPYASYYAPASSGYGAPPPPAYAAPPGYPLYGGAPPPSMYH